MGGAPLLLEIKDGEARHEYRLGPDWLKGEHPQALVPARVDRRVKPGDDKNKDHASSIHELAAIDGEGGAGDPACLVCGEKHHAAGDLIGLP